MGGEDTKEVLAQVQRMAMAVDKRQKRLALGLMRYCRHQIISVKIRSIISSWRFNRTRAVTSNEMAKASLLAVRAWDKEASAVKREASLQIIRQIKKQMGNESLKARVWSWRADTVVNSTQRVVFQVRDSLIYPCGLLKKSKCGKVDTVTQKIAAITGRRLLARCLCRILSRNLQMRIECWLKQMEDSAWKVRTLMGHNFTH